MMRRQTLPQQARPEWKATWPAAADPAAAERLRERFAAIGPDAARLAAGRVAAPMLDCLGGNSPYLSDLAVREAAMLRPLITHGPAVCVEQALRALADTPPDTDRARIATALRQAKRQVALATAVADIGGLWDLKRVTAALSDLAEAALRLAVDHLLLDAYRSGALRLADPAQPSRGSGFTVLGMGKLGARELNYSSDIDLVLLYDPGVHSYPDATPGAVFGRIARGITALMDVRDSDGYVFRTDFRLRPDPAATPLAVSLPTALIYYESMGQSWERAAYIKARPVAGDLALGASFLDSIRPFVWRRHLDFAAISDIHAMKRRIDQHRGGALAATGAPLARLAGHNLKLGQGGIREVEFIAQALQMAWGGQNPALRAPTTLAALRLLSAAGKLAPRAVTQLTAAYRFLRGIEHRLQMVGDRQTHSLPADPAAVARFALFAGFTDAEAFAATLLDHLAHVQLHFSRLFEGTPPPPDDGLRFHRADPDTKQALSAMGFAEPARIAEAVQRWLSGNIRALRTQRARDLLEALLPALLAALARQTQPDAAFTRFDVLLSRLPAGVQLFSLIQRHPVLLDRIAAVLGAAPSLADHLANTPSALEGLLAPSEIDPAPARTLRRQLGDARGLEDAIALTRRFVRGEEFRLAVATMEGRLDADSAGAARSALADAALDGLLTHVMADFTSRYGVLPGGGMAILALGKAGGQEMMAGSDLDLMLLYDHPEAVAASGGGLAPSQYFSRAAHAVIAAITARGAEGPLYDVDMRLRPSGNKGPVAVSLASFRRYHAEDAWTWERMALTRARLVAGPPALRHRIADALAHALTEAGPPDRIRADATAMRARLARDLPAAGVWDVKHRRGGLMEVEFIAQVLQLVHGRDHPAVLTPNTVTALQRLAPAGLLAEADAAVLIRADRLWRTVQGMLRITMGRVTAPELPEPAAQALLHAAARAGGLADGIDLPGLHATLDAMARDVRALFIRHVGDPEKEQT